MNVVIRPAATADAEQISVLVYEVVPSLGYGTEAEVARFIHEQYRPDVIRAGIDDISHRWLVATDRSATICGAIYLDAGARYFGGLHVRTRRQGTGRALMQAMVDLADQLGVDVLTGSVLATNHAALELTAQHGFRITSLDPYRVYFMNAPFMWIVRDTR